MQHKVLIVESSRLHSQSLKGRLESLGLLADIASNKAELAALAGSDFELAITDSSLSDCPEDEHFEILKRQGKPVWLWSDSPELLGNASRQIHLGLEKSFRKLNRADLVHSCEEFFKKAKAAGEPSRSFLLVEDSATVRAYVRRVLMDRFPNSEITEADDGKAAIAAMKSAKVDIVVTDLQMPGMDGASFVHTLKNNPVLAKKPVVILSGMITAKVREEMAGMAKLRFLPKPASPDALEEAVRALLNDEGVPA